MIACSQNNHGCVVQEEETGVRSVRAVGMKTIPPTTDRERSAEEVIKLIIDLYERDKGSLKMVAGAAWHHIDVYTREEI
jgi:hypothetical protein